MVDPDRRKRVQAIHVVGDRLVVLAEENRDWYGLLCLLAPGPDGLEWEHVDLGPDLAGIAGGRPLIAVGRADQSAVRGRVDVHHEPLMQCGALADGELRQPEGVGRDGGGAQQRWREQCHHQQRDGDQPACWWGEWGWERVRAAHALAGCAAAGFGSARVGGSGHSEGSGTEGHSMVGLTPM